MKKLLLLILLSISLNYLYAQTGTLTGFWGLTFGESKASCKQTIKTTQGKTLLPSQEAGFTMTYSNVKFAGMKADAVVLGFSNDKLFVGAILIKPESPTEVLDLYSRLFLDLSRKYHMADNIVKKFTYPYNETDPEGERIVALKSGYAQLNSEWEFSNPTGYKDKIRMEVDKDCYITIRYTYGPIYELLSKQKAEVDNSDL
jgi:hypothetical protein